MKAGILALLACCPLLLQAQGQDGGNQAVYYSFDQLNAGLEAPAEPIRRVSPQDALNSFLEAARRGDHARAAHLLNLNHLDRGRQAEEGPVLARKLNHLITKHIWIDWDEIPDRPDAADMPMLSASFQQNGMSPRKLVPIGHIRQAGHDVTLRMQRVKTPDAQPVWVFSRQSVSQINALYKMQRPGMLHNMMPPFLQVRMSGNTRLWHWLLMALFLLISLGVGWTAQKTVYLYLKSKEEVTWSVRLAETVRLPITIGVLLATFHVLVFSMLELPADARGMLAPVLFGLIMVDITWLGIRAINFGLNEAKHTYLRKKEESINNEEDNDARRVVTYFTIGRMVFLFLIFFIGVGVILSRFELLHTLGVSLMASAGAASVVVGFAAHRVLGNLIAGVQIAITQPIRIGDTVHFEGDWSYVEEINYTHLVLRSWDQRRIIVPIGYFMTHPIENWSASKPSLTKPILLHTDYRIDVQQVREKFEALIRAHELWDESEEPLVQVYDCKEETLLIRCLCSAADASGAWQLHCELREAMVEWLQQLDGGAYLPRKRIAWQGACPENHPQENPPGGGTAG